MSRFTYWKRRGWATHVTPKKSSRNAVSEWPERETRARVEEGHVRKVLVIDTENGDYGINEDTLVAAHRALAEHPGAALNGLRVGYPADARISGGSGVG